jgi:hypothetical protein
MALLPPADFLAAYQLYADPDAQLLICCRPECGFALSVARSQVTTHLREKHGVSEALRKQLIHYVRWKSRVLPLVSGFPVYSLGSPTF